MLRFRSLASGSSGNATLLEASDGLRRTRVLIDCGLGLRQLTARLAADGLSWPTWTASSSPTSTATTSAARNHGGGASRRAAVDQRRHRASRWPRPAPMPPIALQPRLVRDGQVFSHRRYQNSTPSPCRTTRANRCSCVAPMATARWAC
jgi:hypothetical protein